MAHILAAKEGLFVGHSSGAAMVAALEVAMEIGQGLIAVIFPDGGWRHALETMAFWLIDKRTLYRLIHHARLDYPNEACGILLCPSKRPNEIVAAFKAKNASKERLRDRYSLDPIDFLKALEYGEMVGLEVCGFYHSHPDRPAIPSPYDREMAWNSYMYLILEVRKGRFSAVRAWTTELEEQQFKEEAFTVRPKKGRPIFYGER